MSSLSYQEKRRLEKLFKMSSGYVLDFSNRSFADFFNDILDIDIFSSEYAQDSGSKANRLRAFWKVANDNQVAILLHELIKVALEDDPDPEDVEFAKEVVSRLRRPIATDTTLDDIGAKKQESIQHNQQVPSNEPIEIFFSYAREDKEMVEDIYRQMKIHERQELIKIWYDRMIPSGEEWEKEIDQHLCQANIILLFLSPHFIESRYCYEIEGKKALKRHEDETARVIPVILRPCDWQKSPFGKFQALPPDGQPISQYKDCDQACLLVAKGIMAVIQEITRQVYNANLGYGPSLYDVNNGIYYHGVCHTITFKEKDLGKNLIITVDSKNRSICWIELWRGAIGEDPIEWTKRRTHIARSSNQPHPNPSLTWKIEPGDYTIYFVTSNLPGKISSEKITYTILVI